MAGGLGYLVAIWPAPEPFVVPHDRDPVAVIPMTAVDGIDDSDHCMALLEDWVRRPHWVVTLDVGVSGCTGDYIHDSLTVDSAGDAAWSRYGLPSVPLHLTPPEIAELHAAAPASCRRPDDVPVGLSSSFVDVHWGGAEAPARRVRESDARDLLSVFVSNAIQRYRYRRIAERADYRATFVVERYTVPGVDRPMTITFDGRGALTIRLRGRTIKAETLDIESRVDAIDWIEADGPATYVRMPPGLLVAVDRATFDAGLQN
jgi:hypothetical protein